MEKIYSAGGIVVKNKSILMLRKKNGDWVLPKGRIEIGETKIEAAIREVEEETGIFAKVIKEVGNINYQYYNTWNNNNERVDKYVTWFLMREINGILKPLYEEGFVEAKYISIELFEKIVKHEAEKNIIQKAIKVI